MDLTGSFITLPHPAHKLVLKTFLYGVVWNPFLGLTYSMKKGVDPYDKDVILYHRSTTFLRRGDMVIAKASFKGQVLIPVALRRKYNIQKGSRLSVEDGDGQIIFKVMPNDPVGAAHGFLKQVKGPSALKVLMEERRKESKR